MHKARFFLGAALLMFATWFMATSTYGFEIAIYYDPLSHRNQQFQYNCRYGYYWGSRTADSAALFSAPLYTPAMMDSVYKWYQEMGVTKVMVNYPFLSNFAEIPNDSSGIKVMNWNYPGHNGMRGEKYVDSQFRNVQVGLDRDANPSDPNRYWSYGNAIGDSAERTTYRPPNETGELPVVAIGPGINSGHGVADTLWRATSNLGCFSGWDFYNTGWLDSSIYMPMHYKLTWAVDPNGAIDTSTALADFYWIVSIPSGRASGEARWWRYPAHTLKLHDPADVNYWNETWFSDSGASTGYCVLDSAFNVIAITPTDSVYYGPAKCPNALTDFSGNDVSYGGGSEVRMAVYYRGTHTFYLNRIEVYDEGNYRLFASGTDTTRWKDSIRVAFQQEMDSSRGKSAGWYYDEWDESGAQNGNPVLRSIVKVNGILQSATPPLPAMFINGHNGEPGDTGPVHWSWRGMLFDEEGRQGVTIPVGMDEFYFEGGGRTCHPKSAGGLAPEKLWTDTSSDVAYIDAPQCTWIGFPQYQGYKSLQCALDGHIWNWDPIYSLLGDNTSTSSCFSQATQAKYMHDHGRKYWSLVAGGQDSPDVDSRYSLFPHREPKPNEVKLNAWLAVACNADGIMWYPWSFGGLLDWTNNETEIQPNERYWAAKEACNDIQQRVAPILESLEFVKTYASRAFERIYPDATYPATAPDTLADCNWCSHPVRTVQAIRSYELYDGQFQSQPESVRYVQVSRFRNRHVPYLHHTIEDYWFLVVNRRALSDEVRKIELDIPVIFNGPYYVRYVVGDSTVLLPVSEGREENCHEQTITLYLQPGEAELVHFMHGENGCQDASAHVEGLTAIAEGDHAVRLRWEEPTQTEDSLPFTPQAYFILRSETHFEGQFDTMAYTETNTYLDSLTVPVGFYMVHACGTIAERPGRKLIDLPERPRKVKLATSMRLGG